MLANLISKDELLKTTGLPESTLRYWRNLEMVSPPQRKGLGRGRGSESKWSKKAVLEIQAIQKALERGIPLVKLVRKVRSEGHKWWESGSGEKFIVPLSDVLSRLGARGAGHTVEAIAKIVAHLIEAGILQSGAKDKSEPIQIEFTPDESPHLDDLLDVLTRLKFPSPFDVAGCLLLVQRAAHVRAQIAERIGDLEGADGTEKRRIEEELTELELEFNKLKGIVESGIRQLNGSGTSIERGG